MCWQSRRQFGVDSGSWLKPRRQTPRLGYSAILIECKLATEILLWNMTLDLLPEREWAMYWAVTVSHRLCRCTEQAHRAGIKLLRLCVEAALRRPGSHLILQEYDAALYHTYSDVEVLKCCWGVEVLSLTLRGIHSLYIWALQQPICYTSRVFLHFYIKTLK